VDAASRSALLSSPPSKPALHEHAAIARNAASSYGVRVLLALSVLLLTPYLFRTLGAAGFGTWSVIFTVTTVFSLLELGFSGGIVKLVAELRAQGNKKQELDTAIGSAVALMAALGLIAFGISVAIALFATGLAANGLQDDFRTGMLVIGVAMLVRFPFVAYAAALMGYQRYDLFNASQALTYLTFAVGAVIAIETNADVLGLAIAQAVSVLAGGLLFAVSLARTDRSLPMRPRFSDSHWRKRIASFSSFTLLADSMVFIGQRMDTLVIAAIRNAAAAAPYAAAIKLQSGLQSLTLPFVNLLMPMASDLQARGRHEEVLRRFVVATRVVLQVTMPVAIGLALFSTDIVDLWLGSDAPSVTATIIVLLMSVQTVTLTATPAEKVLVGVGRVRTVALLALVEGFSNLGISIALVSAYGAIGAAIGTLSTSAVLAPIKFPLACRATGCDALLFLRRGLGIGVVSSIPGVLVMVAAWLVLPHGAIRLLVGMTLGLSACAIVGLAQVGPARARTLLRSARSERESSAQFRLDSQPAIRAAQ
jgi:O-antigen/teichoic acid export membrane protein